jgi:hypothetical protein
MGSVGSLQAAHQTLYGVGTKAITAAARSGPQRPGPPRVSAGCWLALLLVATRLGAQTDWLQFDFDARHTGVNPFETQITSANVGDLRVLFNVTLPDVADGAPAYLSGVPTASGKRDLLFLTTRDGRLLALDALSGATVWARQPANAPQYRTSSPAIDPNRQFVYSYGLDGRVHKYQVADGTEVTSGGWPELTTLKPQVEKGSSALSIATLPDSSATLYVANGGYLGDAGDYQGHVTAIALATGSQIVFNADCSDQAVHFTTGGSPDCPNVQSAVWSRPGVVYDAELDRILFATGNGLFDAQAGRHDWGDSVLALRPDGSSDNGEPLDAYTPTNFQFLDQSDSDLGSMAPVLLPSPAGGRFPHLAVQGGKDGHLRLLNLDNLSGEGGPGHIGGELQDLLVPQRGEVLPQPAAWTNPADGSSWVFVANDAGISGLQLVVQAGGTPQLVPRWSKAAGGSSPIVADGLLFYVGGAGIGALNPLDGSTLWNDRTPAGIHWESPIVVNGRLYVTDEGSHLIAYAPTGGGGGTCRPGDSTLCLLNGRLQVQVAWTNQFNGTSGVGHAIRVSDSTGFFNFTDPSNIELLVKALDFGNVVKFFYGELTNLDFTITVTDMRDGTVKSYQNTPGDCGAIDETAFPAESAELVIDATTTAPAAGRCRPGPGTLCLLNRQLSASVTWHNQFDGSSGDGRAVPLSEVSGRFSFTDPSNVELVLKALPFGIVIKFFYGSLSDFEYTITLTNTLTGSVRTYHNPPGTFCGGIDDHAF